MIIVIISANTYYFTFCSVAFRIPKYHHLLTGIAFEGNTTFTKTVGGSVHITQHVFLSDRVATRYSNPFGFLEYGHVFWEAFLLVGK